MCPKEVRYELLHPDELDRIVRKRPIAYIPLGSLEWHGRHLPLGNDAIKAYEICLRAAKITGGVVFPPIYWGAECLKLRAIGIRDGTVDIDYFVFKAFLLDIVRRVMKQGFRVIVLLTGHYSREQVSAIKEVAEMCERITESVKPKGTPSVRIIALPEYELALDLGYHGDHAAKWETSILMYLRPELVDMEKLTDLLGVDGEDPRKASKELGEKVVTLITNRLCKLVRNALRELKLS
ncbi:MAG: creatininase family protein [Thermoprotei archaeon]|nr:creatininase family protein [Thermoprotei archaeon]